MKALRLVAYNENYQLRSDVPVPIPGPGELLIRVAAAGFCHTDYQVYQGAYGTQLPFTGSHEPAGTIVKLGPDVPGNWKVNDPVAPWMPGILRADGRFAEYMIASYYALVHLPDNLPFEQAASLMCADATVWNVLKETGLKKGQSIAIIGIGGLGVLAVQFAKSLGLRVVAVDSRDIGLKFASEVPAHLRPDQVINFNSHDAIQKISEFTDGIGLNGVVVCTDDVPASDWALHCLQPRGVCVVLGLPESGFHFDAFNLMFREIVVKGSLHCPVDEVKAMIKAVSANGGISHLTILPLKKAEDIPDKAAAHLFTGRLVVTL